MANGEVEGQPDSLTAYADWALEAQVGMGKFQLIYALLLGLAFGLPCVHTYAHIFIRMSSESYNPPFGWHRACEPGLAPCATLHLPSNCSNVPLEQWVPDVSGRSIVADFKLICSRAYMVPLLGSIFFCELGDRARRERGDVG